MCESHDSVVLCSLVTGHMHIIKDLAGGCRSQHEVVYRPYVYNVPMYDPAPIDHFRMHMLFQLYAQFVSTC